MAVKPNPNANANANDLMIDSHGMVNGETVAQWTVDWFKRVFNTPLPGGDFANSPLNDTTGAWANYMQPSGMFFLAGTFLSANDQPVSRTFTAPAHTPLLAPLLNANWVMQQGDLAAAPPSGKAQANQTLNYYKHDFSELFLKIDGNAVTSLQSDLIQMPWTTLGSITPGSVLESINQSNPLVLDKNGETEFRGSGYWAVIKNFDN